MTDSESQSGHETPEIGQQQATEQPTAKPGSKAAVLKHFGVFKDDGDVEKELAGIRARRELDR